METMRDGQSSEGAYPNVSPWESWDGHGAGAWADAGIVVPWTVYLMTGDNTIIKENYQSMEKYMDWLSRQKGDGYSYNGAGTTYGDWLSFVNTDSRYVSVCYYAYDAMMMERMSRALSTADGDEYDLKAQKYRTLFNNIKTEFGRRYLSRGTPTQRTMTGYLLALKFDLLPDDDARNSTITLLRNAITNNMETLNTGFVGTGILNPTLSECGLTDKAYNLLLQRRCPSWLYSVDQGATTTWERWDSYRLDKGFGDYSMNSFNHYAYGAVGEWMYRFMAGIDTDEENPGFTNIILRPTPDTREKLPDGQERITHASATYESVRGHISSAWESGEQFTYQAEIPANTTATLYMPIATPDDEIFEGALPVEEAEGVEVIGRDDTHAILRVASGKYSFTRKEGAGIDNVVAGNTRVTVYPNPTRDILHIASDCEIGSVTLYDTAGPAMLHVTENCSTLDISTLPSGLYILSADTADGPFVTKIVKQ